MAAVTAAGRVLLQAVGVSPKGRFESLVISVAIGFAFGAYLVIGFGQAGWLTWPMAWTVFGILVLVGIPTWRKLRPRMCWEWAKQVLVVLHSPGWRRWLLLGVAAVFILSAALNLVSVLAPPTDWDTLTYHLAEPSYFIRQGKMSFIPYRDWPNPFTAEMWNVLALLLGSDRLAQVFQWCMGLAAASALYILAAHRTSRSVGFLAATVFYASPHVLSLATSAKSDLAWMTFLFLSLHTLLCWKERGEVRWLWLSALFTGLTLATKFQGLLWAPAIGLALLFLQGADWKRAPGRVVGRVALYGVITGVIASPWWIRNWVGGGDPIWPYGYPVFHSDYWSQTLHNKYASWNQGPGQGMAHYILGLWNLTVNQSAWQFGLRLPITPVVLGLLPLVVVLWGRVSKNSRVFLMVIFLAVFAHYTIWFETYQQTRYLFPALALLVVPATYALLHLLRNPLTKWVAVGFVAISLVFFLGYGILYNAQFLPVAVGAEQEDDFLAKKVSFYEDIGWVNNNLPADGRLLFYPLKTYYLDRDYRRTDGTYWMVEASTPPQEYLDRLKQSGITHVFVTGDILNDDESVYLKDLIVQLKSSGDLKVVYSNPMAILVESRTLARSSRVLVEVLEVVDSKRRESVS
jgi:hypothetical protein